MKFKTPYYNWQSYKFGSISLCMIMRDSAKTLRRCLDNLVGLVDVYSARMKESLRVVKFEVWDEIVTVAGAT